MIIVSLLFSIQNFKMDYYCADCYYIEKPFGKYWIYFTGMYNITISPMTHWSSTAPEQINEVINCFLDDTKDVPSCNGIHYFMQVEIK
jgi:hypothetical protein